LTSKPIPRSQADVQTHPWVGEAHLARSVNPCLPCAYYNLFPAVSSPRSLSSSSSAFGGLFTLYFPPQKLVCHPGRSGDAVSAYSAPSTHPNSAFRSGGVVGPTHPTNMRALPQARWTWCIWACSPCSAPTRSISTPASTASRLGSLSSLPAQCSPTTRTSCAAGGTRVRIPRAF